MARAYAKVLLSIWHDADFCALSVPAQRMFLLLISQPKLSNCGVIDYVPTRWTKLASDTSLEAVEAAVAELEAARYVVVDRDAHELLVRSYVKNDGMLEGRWTMTKAVWNAWEAVVSPTLREVLVTDLPEAAWEKENVNVPSAAKALRTAVFHRRREALGDALAEQLLEPHRTTETETHVPGEVVDIQTARNALKASGS
jgi:hypothetical protein